MKRYLEVVRAPLRAPVAAAASCFVVLVARSAHGARAAAFQVARASSHATPAARQPDRSLRSVS